MRHLPVDPHTLLTLLTALPLVGLLLWVFTRHCAIAIGLLLGIQIWAVAVGGQSAALDIGVRIYPADVLTACALCVALVRVSRRGPSAHAGLFPVMALVVLAGWSTLRGIATFGLQAAGNDSRVYFWHFLAIALYIATVPQSAPLGRVVTRAWLATAAAYALLSLIGWAGRGLHAANTQVAVGGVAVDSRPVPAAAALVLTQAAALLLCPLRPGASVPGPAPSRTPEHGGTADRGEKEGVWRGRARPLAALLLLVLVVLLQHRTIWVAAAAMAVAWWGLRPARAGQRMASATAGALVLCLTVLLFSAGALGAIGGSLADSFRETQGTHSTFAWRVIGWQDLLNAPRSPAQWLIGAPFGSGYERYFAGGLVTVSPHDYYLHVMLRLGLAGVVALLVLYFVVWRWLVRGGPGTLALRLAVIGQLVLFVSYSAFPEQAVLLGLSMWQARICAADSVMRKSPSGRRDPMATMPRPAATARPGPAWELHRSAPRAKC
ncbi:O-antigen ligase family protein [Streptomyces sp. NPDC059909]|uniref:O-antigen ligase family protein n=1 Tax=Streptomyces sp. NPDC059909 TaxID=3346998 RepID=UPI003666C32D